MSKSRTERKYAQRATASLRLSPIAASLAKMGRQAGLPALMATEMLLCGHVWADTPRIPVNALPSTPTTTYGSAINYQVNGSTATIRQTTPTNIVQWNSFDIGQNARLNIVQPSSTAVLLNNVAGGAYMNKTVIDGVLNANGRVYIYNPNGILFGKTGTVNVDTLMASSLKFDESRVIGGLLQPGATPVLGADSATGHIPGDILVEAGANLNANNGGLILLAAPNVVNNGMLNAPDGQVILAAGSKVYLAAPQVSQSGTSLRGLLVEVSNDYPAGSVASAATVGSSTGENGVTGQISVGQGNATMIGYAVNQNGIVSATTSVNLNGSIYLYARDQAQRPDANGSWTATRSGKLTLGGNSVTEVLPTLNDLSTISATTAFNKSDVKLNGQSIVLQQNSSVIAPGGNVTIKAEQLHVAGGDTVVIDPTTATAPRVDFAQGSLVDVSGSSGTKLAMENNVITVDLRGTELADNVVLRNSPLYGTKVNIDIRKGTPVANVSGWLDLVQYNLGQKNATGGTVNVSAEGAIIQRAGSRINVDGGWVDYQDGHVNTTQLQLGDKRVDIGSAKANTLYSTAVNLPDGPNNFELGYRQGSSAGTVKFSAPILALQGELSGQIRVGLHQRDVTATNHPQGGQLQIGNVSNDLVDPTTGRAKTDTSSADKMGFTGDLRIGDTATENAVPPAVGEAFDLGNADQSLLATRLDLDSNALALAGFSRFTALTSGNINVTAPINLAAGGHLWLGAAQGSPDANGNLHHGGDIQFGAPVNIAGGSVTAAASGTLQIADGEIIDLAGRWVNDQILTSPMLDGSGNPVTPLALKGGKLNLSASQLQVGNNVSADVSAGAWLDGQAKTSTGSAGSITLEAVPLDPILPANSALRLGSGLHLSGYGFSSGGSLKLVGRNVTIGATSANANDADLWLKPAFFQQGGFTNYDIAANVNFDVLSNTLVKPLASSWVLNAGSNRLSSGTMGTVASPYLFDLSGAVRTRPSTSVTFRVLPSPLASAGRLVVEDGAQLVLDPGANLSLYAGRQLTVLGTLNAPAGHISLGLNPEVSATPYNATRSIWFGPNAQILAAGSRQRLYTSADGVSSGEVLDGGTIQVGYMNNGALESAYGYVVAEKGASFDVGGISATGLRFKIFGAITPMQDVASSGGSIEIRARDGLLFDGILSGAAGGAGASGGSLTVALEGVAIPNGYPSQLGGKDFTRTLTLLPSRTAAGSIVPHGLQPDQVIVTDVVSNKGRPNENDLGWFLKGSLPGTNAEYLGEGWISETAFASGGFGRLDFKSKDVLAFGLGKADLTLSARDSLILDAPNLRAFNNSANNSPLASTTTGGNTLTLSAPYIQLGSADVNNPSPVASSTGIAQMNANGTAIDLIGNSALQGFDVANLKAKADIRLTGVVDILDANGNATGHTQGSLAMVGNLTLTDAQTYPTTMSNYTFMVAGNGQDANSGTLTFASNGNTPEQALSAGGSLTAIAQHIIQGGQVVAPFGSITLGNSDDRQLSGVWDHDQYGSWIIASSPNNPIYFGALTLDNLRFPNDPRFVTTTPDVFNKPIVTADLTYKFGSVTSVAGSAVVPFGSVSNGSVPTASTWTYNNAPISIQQNTGNNGGSVLPGKAITSNAQSIKTDSGSVQDLSGGGSLLAYEFTPGKGGSKDVLANTTPGSATFAINPNFHGRVAPIDAEYGNAGLKPGDSVYLSGIPGLVAGIYTLLPAHYALLPGGFSITAAPGTRDMQPGSNIVQADGSLLVSGHWVESGSASASGSTRSNGFIVSSSSVVKSKSEFARYDATTYFSDKAKAAGVAAPELPVDGGHIAFAATDKTASALVLNGSIDLDPAGAGRHGSADISAPQIEVVSDRNQSTGNAIKLVAGDLAAMKADSLLLGGLRDTANGSTHLTVGSSNVTLGNDAQLSGPEVVMVASDSINLNAGAAVQGRGALGGTPQNLTVDGSGALLRVSSGDQVGVTRSNSSTNKGKLNIASGATVGASGSAIIDGTAGVTLGGQLAMDKGSALALGAPGISLGADIPVSLPSGKLQLGTAALAKLGGLSDLAFNSYASTIDLYGTVNLGNPAMHSLSFQGAGLQGHAGAVDVLATIVADTVRFAGSSASASGSAGATPAGTLTVQANTLEIGNNAFAIHGYADSTLTARGEVKAVGASGRLSVDKDLTLAAGRIATASGAAASFTAGGDMTLTQSDANGNLLPPPSTAPGMGGQLNFSAANIISDAQIMAPSGKVVMSASDSVDISGGQISTAGKGVIFGSTTAYAPGGSIALNGGNVTVESGAVLDVSAVGASAGKLSITASSMLQLADHTMHGAATAGSDGLLQMQGQFALDTDQADQFGALNAQLNAAGLTESRQFRFRNGDVALGGHDKVIAHQLVIAADNGSITIGGNATIDATGAKGGSIELYASQTDASGDSGKVTLRDNVRLLANSTVVASSDAGSSGNGGTVVIGTGNADGVAATSVAGGSSINLLGGSIDVGGSSAARNGSVTLRAPRVVSDGSGDLALANDVAVAGLNTTIKNSSTTVVEAYGVYQGSTIIGTDPVANHLENVDLSSNLDPTSGGSMYLDAASLMANQVSIQARLNPAGNSDATTNFSLRPGIEIQSSGDLTVSVNEFAAHAADRGWNLNAWRFGADNAPVTLTMRAAGNLSILGAISDGFVKPANSALAMPDWKLDSAISASYRLAAGSDLTAANPLAVQSGSGDVTFGFADRTPTSDAPLTRTDAPVALVRTGTGRINVAAGQDVTLGMANFFVNHSSDPTIDGTPVIYDSFDQTFKTYKVTLYGASLYTAGQADSLAAGFAAPQNALNTHFGAGNGTMTSATFGSGGGAIAIDAGRDVNGPQNMGSVTYYRNGDGQAAVPFDPAYPNAPATPAVPGTIVMLPAIVPQLANDWLFRQGRSYVDANRNVVFEKLGNGTTLNTAWWSRYDYFNQGIATFGGGDVRVMAAANVSDLSASVATNAYLPGVAPTVLKEQGGGDLSVRAGGDIRGGNFYVQKGAATLRADGAVTAGDYVPNIPYAASPTPALNPVLALGDATINVTAGRSLAIETAYNPTLTEQSVNNVKIDPSGFGPINGVSNGVFWDMTDTTPFSIGKRQQYGQFSNFSTYGANSAVNLLAVGGDVLLANDVGSLAVSGGNDIPNSLSQYLNASGFKNLYVLEPARFSAAALSGNLSTLNAFTMMPASTGQLDLLAAGTISLSNGAIGGGIRMLDNEPAAMSNLAAPRIFTQTDLNVMAGTTNGIAAHVLGGLHTGDTQPVEIVAVAGDIKGDGSHSTSISLPKLAQIQAGNDILDLGFSIQQNSAADVTTVTAGRDFIDSTQSPNPSLVSNTVTGPGRIDISAGRNVDFGNGNGLVTRGNLDNPYLAEGGAGINIVAGVQPDYASFVSFAIAYGSVDAVASSAQDRQDLRVFVSQHKAEFSATASAEDLWAAFRSLSQFNQAQFLDAHPAVADRLAESAAQIYLAQAEGNKPLLNTSFFASLVEVSKQSNLGNFDHFIASLFPKAAQAKGGDIDVFASQIKTEQGGSINLFTPAGSVYAGLTTGTASKKPSEQGIFTIRGGAVNALVKNDFLVNQGRVFTLGGGDINLVSQYNDISAGKGAKTASSAPPPLITIDPNGNIKVDVSGSISGSGIATLKTHADQPDGNINVIAPRGIVDGGDAGVRSSGAIFVKAPVVLNGNNFTSSSISGVPTVVAAPALGGIAAPASANSNSSDATKGLGSTTAESANSALNVEVLGYGGDDSEQPSGKSTDGACKKDDACDDDKRKKTI